MKNGGNALTDQHAPTGLEPQKRIARPRDPLSLAGGVTSVVRVAEKRTQVDTPLKPGDELRCPHCHRWHAVIVRHAEGTEYTRQMLYFICRQSHYYAGQVGTSSRHQTRRPATSR